MLKKNKQDSAEELVVKYLKKNNDIFLNHPELFDELYLPTQLKGSNKVFDLNAYRSRKFKDDYDQLKKQMSEIIKAGNSHVNSQKRILKTSLKVLNTKSLSKLINLFIKDLRDLLTCDFVNCFFTSNNLKHSSLFLIDQKIASSYFRDNNQVNLNQNPKGIDIFFPNKSKNIKSYILLKINYTLDSFIIALGSKNSKKFSIDQQFDLINYLINIIEIKLKDFTIK